MANGVRTMLTSTVLDSDVILKKSLEYTPTAIKNGVSTPPSPQNEYLSSIDGYNMQAHRISAYHTIRYKYTHQPKNGEVYAV